MKAHKQERKKKKKRKGERKKERRERESAGTFPVADPGFPVGGRGLPRQLHFENFVCQNERIWTLRGGRASGTPPLDPPMFSYSFLEIFHAIIPVYSRYCFTTLLLTSERNSSRWRTKSKWKNRTLYFKALNEKQSDVKGNLEFSSLMLCEFVFGHTKWGLLHNLFWDDKFKNR